MNQADTGRFIATCRKEKGLTQVQLAEKLNITDRAVSKWETGKSMPDSSIMLELCKILGISVNELLSAEKIEMENIINKADETLLELKRKEENNSTKSTVISILFTTLLLIGIVVCGICDFATAGSLTWSLITLSSILFTWIILLPILLFGKRGIVLGMGALSIFIIPFLYSLASIIKNEEIFRIGAVMSVLSLAFIWIIFALYVILKKKKMLATGIMFFLGIPFMFLVNTSLSKMLQEPILDIWDLISACMLLVLALIFLVGSYVKKLKV